MSDSQALNKQQDVDANKFEGLKALLAGWEFTTEYAISVGDAKSGRVFVYESGNFKMSTKIPTGSTSKWPSAMMFAGLVNDGTIHSLDDPACKYLEWWSCDDKDPRSSVTFRMLLSFTSGFGGGHPGEEANTRAAREWRRSHNASQRRGSLHEQLGSEIGADAAKPCNTSTGAVIECAESIYKNVKLIGKPGQVYSYNSNHLMLAAAVSMSASGLSIDEIIRKYLVLPFNMQNSYYAGKCPDFGGSLITTGDDYENFLSGLLNYKALSKSVIDASEQDYTPFMKDDYTLYGDYGFGHFLMCFDSYNGFTKQCQEAQSHMDPGAFGFIPIIDRKYGYYMQVVAAETTPTGSYPLSGIPEYLAVAIKPHIDAIMGSSSPDPYEEKTHSPRFLSLSVADVNYCLDCKLHPEKCS